jgi:hemolysin activation/secretion protein
VTKIEVTGSTILGAKEIEPITKPLEGRTVTLDELRNAADSITQIYLDRGYITSRAILVDQVIENGIVQIRVVEGSVEKIDIEGNRRLNAAYVRSRVALGAGTPLRQDRLEDQLRLLKADPLFANVEASLRPGTQLGQSILTVRVTEAQSFYGLVGSDNYSPPSVGPVRLGGIVGYRNPTGLGDEISVSYFGATTGGSNQYDFNYRVPLNAMNGTLQLRVAPSNNRITDDQFGFLDISGETELYEVSFRQPLVRSPREEFALSLGFSYQDGQTFIFNGLPFPFGIGPDADGNSRVRVLKFGQDYVKRDLQGAWALRSQFSVGLDVFNATTNDSPVPDGRFFSWLAQLQRVQRISEDNLLIAQLDVQLTPDSLLPSQQFVIGGGQSVRGYRQNARSGDNGIRFSLEDRIVVHRDEAGIPVLQFAPFFDAGLIWNKEDNPNELPDQTFLAAFGLGILFQPLPQFSIRLDYAPPLINLDDRGGNAQDDGFYFSVNYQF